MIGPCFPTMTSSTLPRSSRGLTRETTMYGYLSQLRWTSIWWNMSASCIRCLTCFPTMEACKGLASQFSRGLLERGTSTTLTTCLYQIFSKSNETVSKIQVNKLIQKTWNLTLLSQVTCLTVLTSSSHSYQTVAYVAIVIEERKR